MKTLEMCKFSVYTSYIYNYAKLIIEATKQHFIGKR